MTGTCAGGLNEPASCRAQERGLRALHCSRRCQEIVPRARQRAAGYPATASTGAAAGRLVAVSGEPPTTTRPTAACTGAAGQLAEGRKRVEGRREGKISFRQGQCPRGLLCPDRLIAVPCVMEGEGPGPVHMTAKRQELGAVHPGRSIRCLPDRRLVVRTQGCEQRSRGQPANQPFGVAGGRHGVDLRDGPGCILPTARGDDHMREIHQSGGLDPPVAASSAGAQRILDCLLGTPMVACSQPHPGVEECHCGASHVHGVGDLADQPVPEADRRAAAEAAAGDRSDEIPPDQSIQRPVQAGSADRG
jgi:hypothetical protein